MCDPVQLKFVVVGESGVGKTSILRRLSEGRFVSDTQSTMGIEYFTHSVTIGQQPIRLLLWDTAGQERFYSVARNYFRNALGVILVFDITDRRGFDNLGKWLRDVRLDADPHCSVVLIGNKFDRADHRLVSSAEAEAFARDQDIAYLEASALDGTNVDEAFVRAATDLLEKIQTGVISSVKIPAPDKKPPIEKSGCCG
jgi:small GTP-binding protein